MPERTSHTDADRAFQERRNKSILCNDRGKGKDAGETSLFRSKIFSRKSSRFTETKPTYVFSSRCISHRTRMRSDNSRELQRADASAVVFDTRVRVREQTRKKANDFVAKTVDEFFQTPGSFFLPPPPPRLPRPSSSRVDYEAMTSRHGFLIAK